MGSRFRSGLDRWLGLLMAVIFGRRRSGPAASFRRIASTLTCVSTLALVLASALTNVLTLATALATTVALASRAIVALDDLLDAEVILGRDRPL